MIELAAVCFVAFCLVGWAQWTVQDFLEAWRYEDENEGDEWQ